MKKPDERSFGFFISNTDESDPGITRGGGLRPPESLLKAGMKAGTSNPSGIMSKHLRIYYFI